MTDSVGLAPQPAVWAALGGGHEHCHQLGPTLHPGAFGAPPPRSLPGEADTPLSLLGEAVSLTLPLSCTRSLELVTAPLAQAGPPALALAASLLYSLTHNWSTWRCQSSPPPPFVLTW